MQKIIWSLNVKKDIKVVMQLIFYLLAILKGVYPKAKFLNLFTDSSLPFTDLEVDVEGSGKVTDFVRLPLKIGETISMTVTIPDALKGEWELTCFVASHYEAGMRAPASIK
jgi:uncharacterized cupredoxin-like copper-binding protein